LGWLGGAYIAFVSTVDLVTPQANEFALIAARISFGIATLVVAFFVIVLVGVWSRRAQTWGTWDDAVELAPVALVA
jgi:hypothetical protein